jgi:hypothetical protein
MDPKKFDGPAFVNPSHTSYALNKNGNYQTPNLSFVKNKKNDSTVGVGGNKKGAKGKLYPILFYVKIIRLGR